MGKQRKPTSRSVALIDPLTGVSPEVARRDAERLVEDRGAKLEGVYMTADDQWRLCSALIGIGQAQREMLRVMAAMAVKRRAVSLTPPPSVGGRVQRTERVA